MQPVIRLGNRDSCGQLGETPPPSPPPPPHGLINYLDTTAKCRHLKKFTCKGTLRQVLFKVYRQEIQSVTLIFSTQLCELFPSHLLSGSTLANPSLPSLCEYSVLGGRYGVPGLRQINTHATKSRYRKIFLMTTFCIAFFEFYLSTLPPYLNG